MASGAGLMKMRGADCMYGDGRENESVVGLTLYGLNGLTNSLLTCLFCLQRTLRNSFTRALEEVFKIL